MSAANATAQGADAPSCPLCARPVQTANLEEAWWADPTVVQRLVDQHPTWRLPDGACPACLQEALLHVLLSQGDAALHEQVQKLWPLDARAAFGAIPTPLRLHADPRFTGKGITVAMIDAGFYPHPDLTQPVNRIRAWVDATAHPVQVIQFGPDDRPAWPEWDTLHSRQWHGAMTSVVAAGNGQRSHGLYRGLAADATLVLIQAANDAEGITDRAIVQALHWTAHHAAELAIRVVSLSIGAEASTMPPGNPIDAAVHDLTARGVVVVAAAGNDGIRRLAPPASAPEALTIGGLDDHNIFSHEEIELWHSNYGATAGGGMKPDLVAPSIWVAAPALPGSQVEQEAVQLFAQRHREPGSLGVEARIAALKLITPYYQHVDGTSFAAPIAASVVACMFEANPDLRPENVRQILLTTAQPVPNATRERQGAGAIAAGQAVAKALSYRHSESAAYLSLDVSPQSVTFLLHEHQAGYVELFGSWDSWSVPRAMQADGLGVWRALLPRPAPGRYEYKYLIDGRRWLDDPANPHKAWDGIGGFNSLLVLD